LSRKFNGSVDFNQLEGPLGVVDKRSVCSCGFHGFGQNVPGIRAGCDWVNMLREDRDVNIGRNLFNITHLRCHAHLNASTLSNGLDLLGKFDGTFPH
jgi:hypothetical protein